MRRMLSWCVCYTRLESTCVVYFDSDTRFLILYVWFTNRTLQVNLLTRKTWKRERLFHTVLSSQSRLKSTCIYIPFKTQGTHLEWAKIAASGPESGSTGGQPVGNKFKYVNTYYLILISPSKNAQSLEFLQRKDLKLFDQIHKKENTKKSIDSELKLQMPGLFGFDFFGHAWRASGWKMQIFLFWSPELNPCFLLWHFFLLFSTSFFLIKNFSTYSIAAGNPRANRSQHISHVIGASIAQAFVFNLWKKSFQRGNCIVGTVF